MILIFLVYITVSNLLIAQSTAKFIKLAMELREFLLKKTTRNSKLFSFYLLLFFLPQTNSGLKLFYFVCSFLFYLVHCIVGIYLFFFFNFLYKITRQCSNTDTLFIRKVEIEIKIGVFTDILSNKRKWMKKRKNNLD